MCINKISALEIFESKKRLIQEDFGNKIEQSIKMKGELEDGSEVEVLITHKGFALSEVIGEAIISGQANHRLKITLEKV